MQNDIVKKITHELNSGISTEAQVVYLLVGVRKLMEHNSEKNFDTLKMFCDWGLHIDLSRNSQIKNFLGEFDEAIGRINTGYGPVNLEYISFRKFKKALEEFIDEFGLPKNILETAKWRQFIRLYSGVVSDCPVTRKDHSFKFIKEIKIKILEMDDVPEEYKKQREGFHLRYEIIKSDGKEMHWEVIGDGE